MVKYLSGKSAEIFGFHMRGDPKMMQNIAVHADFPLKPPSREFPGQISFKDLIAGFKTLPCLKEVMFVFRYGRYDYNQGRARSREEWQERPNYHPRAPTTHLGL